MNKVYSIIVTYNGLKWIEKCLNSLIESTITSKIIVIDNNSTDNTVSIIEAKYPSVQLIKSTVNLGFGKANNIGLKKAIENDADFAFLLNQDAWINSDTIEKLINTSKLYPNYGIISPVELNGSGDTLDAGFNTYIKLSNENDLISDLLLNNKKDIYNINFINAAGWLITKKCLQKVGGFDSLFYHYGEDVDYCQRAAYKGFSIGISPNSFYYHDRNQTISNTGERAFKDLLNAYLIELKDNSINYRAHFLKTELNLVKIFLINCLKLSFKKSIVYLRLFFVLIKKNHQIKLSRRISLTEQAFL